MNSSATVYLSQGHFFAFKDLNVTTEMTDKSIIEASKSVYETTEWIDLIPDYHTNYGDSTSSFNDYLDLRA